MKIYEYKQVYFTPFVAIQELVSVLHEQSDFVQPSKHLQIPHSHLPFPAHTTLKYLSHDSLSHSQYLPDILDGSFFNLNK